MDSRFKFIPLAVILMFTASCRSGSSKQQGQTQEDGGEFSQLPLIQKLNEQISQSPHNAELYFLRSSAYLQLGNYNNALADIRQALQRDSTEGKYYRLLGEIYFSRQEYTRAITALQKGHQEAPNDIDLMLQLAKYQLYVGERAESIQLLDDVLRKDVFNAEAYFLKGMLFKEIGDTAKAISGFQTAVEQNPRCYEAYMQLGLLLSKKKNPLAIGYFRNALKIDSSSYEARYGIAMYYQEAGDYSKALEIYRQMILDFPQEKDAYYNIGYIHFQMDSIDRASRDFDRAIAVAPDYADAYYMRGLCAEAVKDFKNARYYYEQALNLKAEHALAIEGIKRLDQL